jgi:hypothetical protein
MKLGTPTERTGYIMRRRLTARSNKVIVRIRLTDFVLGWESNMRSRSRPGDDNFQIEATQFCYNQEMNRKSVTKGRKVGN